MIEIAIQAVRQILFLSLPFLIVGLAISVITGFLQAIFQVQDATVSFVPKLLALTILIVLGLPWFLQHLSEYSRHAFENVQISTEPLNTGD